MKTIYKYSLKVTDEQVVKLPQQSQILSVQYQQGTDKAQASGLVSDAVLQLWAMVDSDAPVEDVTIEIFGTGNPIPNPRSIPVGVIRREFISTVQVGPFVWHVFKQVANN